MWWLVYIARIMCEGKGPLALLESLFLSLFFFWSVVSELPWQHLPSSCICDANCMGGGWREEEGDVSSLLFSPLLLFRVH